MAAQDNAKLARNIYESFNNGKFDDVLSQTAENVEIELYPMGQTFHGHDGFYSFMKNFKDAFPDLQIEVTNQVATDNQVVNEFVARGTHTGPLATPDGGAIPPTGKSI